MSSSLKRNECKRQCRYEYTSTERLEKGRGLADEYGALAVVNNDLERVKKDFKARIETHETKIESLAEQVRSGYELRETLCFYTYNEPRAGRKILKRADTFEIIEEVDMTGADTQLVMEALDEEAAREAASKPAPLSIQMADLPLTPWPDPPEQIAVKGSDVERALGSDIFAPVDSTIFAAFLYMVYFDHDAVIDENSTLALVAARVMEEDEATISNFLQWLEERSRPGGRLVANTLRTEHGVKTDVEKKAEAAKTQPAKSNTAGRKARRAASNGVVGTEADGKDLSNPDDSKS